MIYNGDIHSWIEWLELKRQDYIEVEENLERLHGNSELEEPHNEIVND